jgi:hypothetical protein
MCRLEMHVECSDTFFEVLPNEVEYAELAVEDGVSRVLLDLFGGGMVDDVTTRFSCNPQTGLQQCAVSIHAQYFCQSFILFPRTREHMRRAVENSICSLLRELFVSARISTTTFSPSSYDEQSGAISYCGESR